MSIFLDPASGHRRSATTVESRDPGAIEGSAAAKGVECGQNLDFPAFQLNGFERIGRSTRFVMAGNRMARDEEPGQGRVAGRNGPLLHTC